MCYFRDIVASRISKIRFAKITMDNGLFQGFNFHVLLLYIVIQFMHWQYKIILYYQPIKYKKC